MDPSVTQNLNPRRSDLYSVYQISRGEGGAGGGPHRLHGFMFAQKQHLLSPCCPGNPSF